MIKLLNIYLSMFNDFHNKNIINVHVKKAGKLLFFKYGHSKGKIIAVKIKY